MATAITDRSPGPTAMMQQYLVLKAQAAPALLFFRLGDFYELFLHDAEKVAAILDIALTHRGRHEGKPLPMCGVPVQSVDLYLQRLVKAGHSVAIADQIEDPAAARKRGAKAVVRRAIVRVITPGTLTDERLLDGRRANWLLAAFPGPGETGLAWADISTGDLFLSAVAPDRLSDELARLAPAERICPAGAGEAAGGSESKGSESKEGWIALEADAFDSRRARRILAERAGVATLDGLGAFPRSSLAAAAGLLARLERTQCGGPVLLKPPRLLLAAEQLSIDASTRRSLDLLEGPASLLSCIDHCVTAAGSRRLQRELAAPLLDIAAINERLDLVQWLKGDDQLRQAGRELLRRAPDLARATGRIVARRATPKDLAALRDGLNAATELRALLERGRAGGAPPALLPLLGALQPPEDLRTDLAQALVEAPPPVAAEGGVIASGYDSALDEARRLTHDGEAEMAALEGRLRAESGVPGLKIRHNNVLGYHVEVGHRAAETLRRQPQFQHRQTLGSAMRFATDELNRLAQRIAAADGEALALEAGHLERLFAAATAAAPTILAVADALAAIDRSAALAELAARHDWARPVLTDGLDFHIAGGRHPVVEAALQRDGTAFVPNDCRLEGDCRLWLVTGPNMGGKSTFLRQNALIAVLAQSGSFVPALEARLGVVDRLYSRVGASDSLAEGRSTFMVEMVETAAILNGASNRSLLLLDEVGRGTATWDGLALAWAILERIHDGIGARCLFASHYHELSALAGRLAHLALRSLAVRQWQGELVFLHEVKEGAAPGSFGLDVARLAGVPADVVERAATILARLEKGNAGKEARAALADLPLFERRTSDKAPATDAVRARLAAIHPDRLSPRAALDLVYELKDLAAGADGTPE